MTTTVAVVVPCRNEAATIGPLLDAIAAQTYAPDRIVVVDDGSTDGTARIANAWQSAHPRATVDVVAGPGTGVAAAVNFGITASTETVIVRLDGHSVPAADYIERSLAALNASGVGVVGGTWRIEPGAPTLIARTIAAVVSHPLGSGGAQYRHPSDGADRDAVAADTVPFGVFRRDLWIRLGGFDETLQANEDYDFNYRARTSGNAVVLDPRIRSTYFARPTLALLRRQYHRYGFWKARMLQKDPRALKGRQALPAILLPWVVITTMCAVVWPGTAPVLTAAAYPALVVASAAEIALRMKALVAWPLAAAALLVVHMAWSAGFLRAVMGLPVPSSAARSENR